VKDKTIKELAQECHTVDDVHEMLKDLFKDILQDISGWNGWAPWVPKAQCRGQQLR